MRGVILLVAAGAAARLNGQANGLPLQPTRHIRFETHEGTWMSVDVSPDGRTIVFDLLGDLYTVPMAGGRATRITSGIAADYQPRFSPDGRRIVFVSDRDGSFNLWLVAPDGGHPREMTHARYLDQEGRRFLQPVWTPDGRAIVVSESDDASGSFDLMAYDTLGQAWPDVALRAPAPPASDGAWAGAYYTAGAAFGRDFGGLYATQFTGTHGRWDPQAATYQVIHVAWPNGERRTVTTETGSAVQPLVSPDGRYLAYATTYPSRHGPTTGLRLLDQETGVTKWCLDHIEPSLQGSIVAWQQGLLPNAAFTPDGAAIVVSFDGKLWHVAVPSCQVRPIPFTATVDQKLGPLLRFSTRADDGPATARVIRELQPSPDGKWLAFVALGKVWIVALPDGTSQRLTNARSDQTEYAPAWSPDGRYLAFASWSERGGDIY
ncbi:MAG: amidohydrolase, partial [Chloroflexi bacterium]